MLSRLLLDSSTPVPGERRNQRNQRNPKTPKTPDIADVFSLLRCHLHFPSQLFPVVFPSNVRTQGIRICFFTDLSCWRASFTVLWTVLLYPSVSECFKLKRCKVAGQFPQSGKVAKYACNLLALSSITSHVGRTWPKWVGIQYTLWANWCKLCKSFGFLCLAPIGGTLREVHLCYNQ